MELVFCTYFKQPCLPILEGKKDFFWISSRLVFLTMCLKPTLHDKATRWQDHIMPRMVSHQSLSTTDPTRKKVQPQKKLCNPPNTEHKTTCLKWTWKHVALQQPSQKEEEIINQREIHLREYDCSYIWILQHVFLSPQSTPAPGTVLLFHHLLWTTSHNSSHCLVIHEEE